jgi:hypothetical protein
MDKQKAKPIEPVESKEETDRIFRAAAAARIQIWEDEIRNLDNFTGRTLDLLTSLKNRIKMLKQNVDAERASVKE